MPPPELAASAETVASLTARLAAAERALAARDKTVKALITREQDRAAKRHSAFGVMEENAALQQVVARKTLELEAQNYKLEQTSNALRETSGLLEVLMENTQAYIYFKDEQSRFVRSSKSLQNAFGQPDAAAIKGKTNFDFLPEAYARESFAEEQAILRSGEPSIGKLDEMQHVDGRVTWYLTTKMPWRDKDGRIIGTFGISSDLTAIKAAEAELEMAHKQLLETSRLAGMAEVATNVLHNVGNVLNSVNISAGLIVESVKKSKASSLARVVDLLQEHAPDLGSFITNDSRGKHVPAHLAQISKRLVSEQEGVVRELDSLRRNVEHINEIVAMQQNYAKVGGVKEMTNVVNLVEDSLRMLAGTLSRHGVEVSREFEKAPLMNVEKHKILQILVNLLRNAKFACQESGRADKRLTVRVANRDGRVKISVIDNGIGIPPDNLERIFNHGFTTRKGGHGFGLHGGALAAKEMGGSLVVHSDGPGQGAAFILELPCLTPEIAPE
jgi:PAS domain S-box-containing protein